jgi:hypothetical protein
MIISPPFLPAAGLNSTDPTETDPMMAAVESFELPHEGIYPIAFDRPARVKVVVASVKQHEAVYLPCASSSRRLIRVQG